MTIAKAQRILQKTYDENFSFLGFSDFSWPACNERMAYVSHACDERMAYVLHACDERMIYALHALQTHVAFYPETVESLHKEKRLVPVMKSHLIDALLSMQNKIDENVKRLEEIR